MNSGLIGLGGGVLSGACKIGTDNIIIIKKGGAFRKFKLSGGKVSDLGTIGGGTDCFVFPEGTFLFDTEAHFEVADN